MVYLQAFTQVLELISLFITGIKANPGYSLMDYLFFEPMVLDEIWITVDGTRSQPKYSPIENNARSVEVKWYLITTL